jgi:hypothetical protein
MGAVTFQDSQVPAHLRGAFAVGNNADLQGGVSIGYPIVSYKGKTWQVVENGERMLITMPDSDDPAPAINAVIVRANPHLSKVYYPEGYEEGSTEKPTCHSNDSIAPAVDAAEPQSKKCAICPHNQFGSKITESGARGKACSDARRLAIAPENDYSRAMLLRVPAMSLKEMLTYADQLTKRGVAYQTLVTRIGFDHTVAYPKLTFKPQRWLTEDEVAAVQELYDSDSVLAITALNAPSYVEAEAPAETGDDFLPPGKPPAAETTKPKATAGKVKVDAAEVAAAVGETVAAPPKRATGFGGGAAKVVEQVQEPVASNAEVLAAGASAELDKVLAGFDD